MAKKKLGEKVSSFDEYKVLLGIEQGSIHCNNTILHSWDWSSEKETD